MKTKPYFALQILHFLQQGIGVNFHTAEGEPFFAQVLQRRADMVNRVVNTKETVVCVLEFVNGDRSVLRIVALLIKGKLR